MTHPQALCAMPQLIIYVFSCLNPSISTRFLGVASAVRLTWHLALLSTHLLSPAGTVHTSHGSTYPYTDSLGGERTTSPANRTNTHGWYHKVRTVGHTADLLVSAAASHYSVCGSQLCRPAVYFIQEHSFIQPCKVLFRLLPRPLPGCAQADAAANAVISACTVSACTTR